MDRPTVITSVFVAPPACRKRITGSVRIFATCTVLLMASASEAGVLTIVNNTDSEIAIATHQVGSVRPSGPTQSFNHHSRADGWLVVPRYSQQSFKVMDVSWESKEFLVHAISTSSRVPIRPQGASQKQKGWTSPGVFHFEDAVSQKPYPAYQADYWRIDPGKPVIFAGNFQPSGAPNVPPATHISPPMSGKTFQIYISHHLKANGAGFTNQPATIAFLDDTHFEYRGPNMVVQKGTYAMVVPNHPSDFTLKFDFDPEPIRGNYGNFGPNSLSFIRDFPDRFYRFDTTPE